MPRTALEIRAELTAPGGPFALTTGGVGGAFPIYATGPATLAAAIEDGAAHGTATAFVCGDERLSYAETVARARRIALRWRTDGLEPGDRVAVIGANGIPWVLAFFASQLAGAVAVPLNSWHNGAELTASLQDSGAVRVVCDGERWTRLRPHLTPAELPAVAEVVVWDAATDGSGVDGLDTGLHVPVRGWEDVLAAAPDGTLPPTGRAPQDAAVLLSTSGTSGRPKLAVGSHTAHVSQLMNTGLFYATTRDMLRDAGIEAGAPVSLQAFPLFHIAGLINLYAATATGGKVVLLPRWDARKALQLMDAEQVSISAMVPTMLRQLLGELAVSGDAYTLNSVASLPTGGAPLPPDLVETVRATFGGRVASGNGYGLTEITGSATSIGSDEHRANPTSIGRELPTVLVQITDPDTGTVLSDGETGEFRIGGVTVADGYWNRPEETAAAFVDGWFRTGDLGFRDPASGLLHVVDRIKDVIVRGGENVYCAEVEAVLIAHPAVADVAVLGLPDEAYGEIVVAVVEPAGGLAPGLADDLRGWARERLASFKVPGRVEIRSGALPRNAAGKLLKKNLRTELESGEA